MHVENIGFERQGFLQGMDATGGPAEFHHVDVEEYVAAIHGLAREHIEQFGDRGEKALLNKPRAFRDYVRDKMGSPSLLPAAHNESHDKLELTKNRLSREEEILGQMRLRDNPFTRKDLPEQEEHVNRLVGNVSAHKAEVMSTNKALLFQFQGDHNLG